MYILKDIFSFLESFSVFLFGLNFQYSNKILKIAFTEVEGTYLLVLQNFKLS